MTGTTKPSKGTPQIPASSGAPSRRAINVTIAVANPASTSKVPRIARDQELIDEGRMRPDERCWRDELRGDALRGEAALAATSRRLLSCFIFWACFRLAGLTRDP